MCDPAGVEHFARRGYVYVAGRGRVPQRREFVDMTTSFEHVLARCANQQDRMDIQADRVPVHRDAVAMAHNASGLGHATKNSPSIVNYRLIVLEYLGPT